MASRNIGTFVLVDGHTSQFELLVSILKARIPKSANMYNMSLLWPRFADKMKFYTFKGGLDENSWIFATFLRLDYGIEICISAPSAANCIPSDLRQALEDPRESLIDWAKPYELISIDSMVSAEIIDMARRLTKTNPEVHGMKEVGIFNCYHYIPDDMAAPVNERELPTGAFTAPLNTETGAKVLYDEWPYSRQGTEVQCWDLVTRSYSTAVYIDGAPVAWSFLHQCGHMAIQTREPYRGHGFASRCMRALKSELKTYGFIPCAMVDTDNAISNTVMTMARMKLSHNVDFLIFGRS